MRNPAKEDEILAKILMYSYKYTWIFFGSMVASSFINYFAEKLSLGISAFSFVLGFIFSEFVERVPGKYIKRYLIMFSEKSKNPIDKRLYVFFEGWTAFLSALLTMIIASGVFKINPPFIPGIYQYLIAISGILCFGSLFYGIITKKI